MLPSLPPSSSPVVGGQRVDQLMKEIGSKRQQAAAHHKAGLTEDALSFLREGKEGGREGGRKVVSEVPSPRVAGQTFI